MVIPPIVLAVGAYLWLVKNSPPLQKQTEQELARVLETISIPRSAVRPKVSGFGTAKFARSWRAVTQVEGRINKIHAELRPGSRIAAGEVLLEIDDSDYRSQVTELNAAIEQQDAEIQRLEQSVKNDEKNLELENEVLTIMQREYDREEQLYSQRAGSRSEVDQKRRELLSQQKAVQQLKNNIALVAPQIKALQAAKRQSAAQIEQAKRDIERTKITAPFRMRVGEVQLEVGQFVGIGETLFHGYSDAEVEIEAQLALQDIHRLFVAQTDGVPPPKEFSQEDFRRLFSFDASVKVAGLESTVTYPGQFLRVREVVDAQTKMVGFVIGVQNRPPMEQKVLKPPLLEGAFCDIDVYGKTLPDQVVVPRSAIRNGSVFLVDDQNRLEKRAVELTFTQDDYAVVASGLDGGEKLVIANPSPAIIGMLVDPIDAPGVAESLVASVAADIPVANPNQDESQADVAGDTRNATQAAAQE
ncbi:Multidrug resistance protein MdtA precursor [Mariniblastus fucicola]|uniref:Multidrug resistance protein MdtA n=2 Tax=Mariniblastus fucicola TaxID=980251 RepID=A0A5B9PE44_9BACT|nr:Multidrug resistance protein MdtA precursor [Mariniblastus fucicola]